MYPNEAGELAVKSVIFEIVPLIEPAAQLSHGHGMILLPIACISDKCMCIYRNAALVDESFS